MRTHQRTKRTWTTAILLAIILLAACGADSVDTAAGTTAGAGLAVVEETATVAHDPQESTAGDSGGTIRDEDVDEGKIAVEEPQLTLGQPDWEGLTEWNLPAMGGITFGVPAGLEVIHDGDMVWIRTDSGLDSGGNNPAMVISRVQQTATGTQLALTDMTDSAIAGIGSASTTNQRLALFGYELDGWRFAQNDSVGEGPFFSYSAYPVGIGAGPSAWDPFPLAELYLADVPGGVLTVGWTGVDDGALDEARAIFDRIAPTVALTRPFDETAGPVTPFVNDDVVETPPTVALPDGWPRELTEISASLEAGEYSHLGFGTAFSMTLQEGWEVQPNFPSWLVLTGAGSAGPNDRDVVFRGGASRLVPMLREGVAGEGRPFDLRELAEDPPESIEIVHSEDVSVGGADGFRVRFAFDDAIDCAGGEVCEYLLVTNRNYPPASIRVGYHHELWHLDAGIAEPITILTSASNESWLDRAHALLETIEFQTSN